MSVPGEVSGRRFEVKMLPANELNVDPGVQRLLNQSRAKLLADHFEESALGVFTVSARETLDPGTGAKGVRYVVLDGQTRLAALRLFAGTDETTLPVICQVYYGLTRQQQEAEIFLSHNNRAAVRTIDKFRLSIVAREDWALQLNKLVDGHGFDIGRGARASHRFTAVASARKIMDLPDGLTTLNRAFDLLVRAWGHRVNTASAEAIDGVGMLYHRHGAAVDTVGFAKRLARKDTPQTFKANCMAMRGTMRLSRTEAAYRYVLSVYNQGLSTNRLEPRS